jgi:hypothetical protein
MKILYRKPTLIEQIIETIETAKQPIEAIVLTEKEFQSVFNNLDKTKNLDAVTYSYKGITIKVADE